MNGSLKLTKQMALPRIKQYCTYQERSHFDVREKLYGYGLHKNDVEDLMAELITENYLNEERFAIQFAGGKFRIKQWGRNKIKQGLKDKRVSDYCIKQAMKQIDDDAYIKTLNKLAELKLKTLKGEKNIYIKKRKLQDHLLQKGYEFDLVRDAVAGI
jgi:regulatory protein